MKRVLIVGSPGMGKSTFARALAGKTGLPIIYLDKYYNDAKLGYIDDDLRWNAFIKTTISADSWIMDGNYSSSIDMRMKRADVIFVFDYRRWRAFQGLVRRRIEYHSKVRVDMPEGWQERLDWQFMKFVWDYEKRRKISKLSLKLTKAELGEVVTFKGPRDAKAYLEKII
jgi:adenylate kinase family enzyme